MPDSPRSRCGRFISFPSHPVLQSPPDFFPVSLADMPEGSTGATPAPRGVQFTAVHFVTALQLLMRCSFVSETDLLVGEQAALVRLAPLGVVTFFKGATLCVVSLQKAILWVGLSFRDENDFGPAIGTKWRGLCGSEVGGNPVYAIVVPLRGSVARSHTETPSVNRTPPNGT